MYFVLIIIKNALLTVIVVLLTRFYLEKKEKAKIREARTIGTLYVIKTENDPEPLVYISIKSFEDLDGRDYAVVSVVRESHNEQRPL